jgi:hypothetical protein
MAKMDKLTVEECKALYFDSDSLIESPRKLFRLNGYSNGRYYYRFDENQEPVFYISVTNMIEQTMPTSPFLIKWMADMGHDESKEYAKQRADYGTMMHLLFQRLLINKKINFDEIDGELMDYLKQIGQPLSLFDSWIDELKKDVLAFALFLKEYKVKPLAIEMMLASDEGYAGALDLFCEMTIEEKGFHGEVYKSGEQKGKPKETKKETIIKGIVDFKSGRKGFYDQHEIQLEAYRRLLKENFPDFKDENIKIFNFAPNDWRTFPSYKLKDQSDSRNIEKFDYLVALGQIEMNKMDRNIVRINGEFDLSNSVTDAIQSISISSVVKEMNQTSELAEALGEQITHELTVDFATGGDSSAVFEVSADGIREVSQSEVDNLFKQSKPKRNARKNKKSEQPDEQNPDNRKDQGGTKKRKRSAPES